MEIEAKFMGFEDATNSASNIHLPLGRFPQGRAVNLGEVALKNGSGQVKAISDIRTFGVTSRGTLSPSPSGNMGVLGVPRPGDSRQSREHRRAIRIGRPRRLFLVEHEEELKTPFSASTAKHR